MTVFWGVVAALPFLTGFLEQNDASVESQGCLFSLASHVLLLPNVSAFYLAAL